MTLLKLDPPVVSGCLNVRPFQIGHDLTQHPLFALPRLLELARQLPEANVEYNAGNIPVSVCPAETPRTGLSVEETIRRIESCNSWMVLKWVEQDPEYCRLLDRCLDEIQIYSEKSAPGMKRREGFIFISSPGSITPFHFDQEYNFLLQVRGTKNIHVFPRSIVTERDIEARFAKEHRNLTFDETYQRTATTFELQPGQGVHVPIAAPHWVKNGNDVSISFSITFQTPASERRATLYRLNGHIRKLGITPAPVGESNARDAIKFYFFQAGKRALRPLRRARQLS